MCIRRETTAPATHPGVFVPEGAASLDATTRPRAERSDARRDPAVLPVELRESPEEMRESSGEIGESPGEMRESPGRCANRRGRCESRRYARGALRRDRLCRRCSEPTRRASRACSRSRRPPHPASRARCPRAGGASSGAGRVAGGGSSVGPRAGRAFRCADRHALRVARPARDPTVRATSTIGSPGRVERVATRAGRASYADERIAGEGGRVDQGGGRFAPRSHNGARRGGGRARRGRGTVGGMQGPIRGDMKRERGDATRGWREARRGWRDTRCDRRDGERGRRAVRDRAWPRASRSCCVMAGGQVEGVRWMRARAVEGFPDVGLVIRGADAVPEDEARWRWSMARAKSPCSSWQRPSAWR